jgi:leucyl/phenylalanyl-tRNA--protein transferase
VPFPPIEPPPTEVVFPDPRDVPGHVLAMGHDFRPGTLLSAYRSGIFPWPSSKRRVPWCSVDPRAIFPLDREPHWSRSLRRARKKHPWEVTIDAAFGEVVKACRDERPDAQWIIDGYVDGFIALHALGWTHSVEVWETSDETRGARALVGGIYGVAIGGLFAGESMFHRRTDASKIAFTVLVDRLRASGFVLFDVQVMNPHLESLGCVEITRDEYIARVVKAVRMPARELALAHA